MPITPVHRILIASDDSALVASIASALTDLPYLGAQVVNRTELLSHEGAPVYDILLIDEGIGVFDNWSFVRELKSTAGRPITVVGLVQELDSGMLSRQKEFGLDGFLRKAGVDQKFADGLNVLTRKVPARCKSETARHSAGDSALDFVPFRDLRQQILKAMETSEDQPTVNFANEAAKPAGSNGSSAHPGASPPPGSATSAGKRMPSRRYISGPIDMRTGTPPARMDMSGTLLGKVRLESVIGHGAGGTVYKALHTSLDLNVAVKVLHPDLAAADADYRMRFLSEARTAARVSHSNVVRVLDCDRDDATGAYYIVMEYVKGRSLEQELATYGKIAEERLAGIGIGVALALVAAEEEHVIHRDIKPGNILLHKDESVKVTDLGLAQPARPLAGIGTTNLETRMQQIQRNKAESVAGTISNPTIMGTPWYMPPEQITDPGNVDVRADIYAFGATLYHAACGEVPFPGNQIADVLLHHLETDPPDLHKREPTISPAFSRIIHRMMSKKPKDRPAGPREVLSQLREHHQNLIDEKRWKKANMVVRVIRRLWGRG